MTTKFGKETIELEFKESVEINRAYWTHNKNKTEGRQKGVA